MILLYRFLDSLEKQWLAIIVIALWLFLYSMSQEKTNNLLEQTKTLESEILYLEKKEQYYTKIIDSLSKVDTVIVNKIKTIKQKEYVQIKIIDSIPVSELQQFFTDRYSQR